jgi:chemotaxis protein methyltransferase WspC
VAPVDFETVLKQAMGLDAVSIGSTTIERAVRVRMADLGLGRREDYWQQLHDSTGELQELIETVVVPETWFFRDREAFGALVRLVTEEWLPAHPSGVLRLLSVPCSTGEEPYSMIMGLLDSGLSLECFQVDAVDISARALAQARRGIYGMNSFRGANLQFRERYFRPVEGAYALLDQLSAKVTFRQRNLLAADFHFGEAPYDVVFCRNLLIYFDRTTQERAMRTLASILTPGGFLFVGPAEAFLASCSGFVSANQAMSFAFRRTGTKRIESANHSIRRPMKPVKTSERPRTQPAAKAERGPIPVPPIAKASVPPPTELALARSLANAGRLAEAVEGCERHLRQRGPSAEAYYLLGLLRDATGDGPGAAENYRRVVYLEPEHVEALMHLALCMEKHGDAAAAERFSQRARRVEHSEKQGAL